MFVDWIVQDLSGTPTTSLIEAADCNVPEQLNKVRSCENSLSVLIKLSVGLEESRTEQNCSHFKVEQKEVSVCSSYLHFQSPVT